MEQTARVVVDLALGREFDYSIPPELADRVAVGCRVQVPFGRRVTTGYVVGLGGATRREGLKPLQAVVGEHPLMGGKLLDLARWIADYYCAPLELAIRSMLPAPVRGARAGFKQQFRVTLADAAAPAPAGLPPKQAAALDRLRARGPLLLAELLREAGVTAAPVKALAGKGLVRIETATLERNPLAQRTVLRTEPLALMPEQAAALAQVCESIDAHAAAGDPAADPRRRPVLLYGVTGSGKTEVYLQAIAHALAQGRSAIVLVPEISLTPQTVERFAARFGERIAVLHSNLGEGERHDEWHRIRDGRADIVIGARSALFAPVRNLGLIVVDEEHEPSYKQDEAPRYNARDVAVMRGRMEASAVLLGSATPALESWANAQSGKYRLAVLPRRADDRRMPHVRIVDMRIETERTGRASVFSRDLLEAIRLRLDRAEQTMLFLNRRGYATSLVCPKCGFVSQCDQCSVSHTYHRSDESLRCHICGAHRGVPARCPGCQDPAFRFSGIGTQRVETILGACFPKACIERMDADAVRHKGAYDRILGDFRTGKIDILIGTQMIAKGLHFPNVTLVGVIYADLSLHLPDFRAGERTFQLLAQVAGRAGRGDVAGEVVVQTYTPFHAAVQAARQADYARFSDQEMEARRELSYPPFTHLTCLTFKGASEARVVYFAEAVAKALSEDGAPSVRISPAAPAPLARAKGLFRYQVMLRSRSVKAMTGPLKAVLARLRPPAGVTIAVDVDALSLM